jgi:predicted ATPase
LANQLAELLPEVRKVKVDKDDKRRLLTLEIVTKNGQRFPARSLSDGTLRFLALSILKADYTEDSLICLEEPENGIHPERIITIISLLEEMTFDPEEEYEGAPLRQVIINTHSPGVVSVVPDDSLVYVDGINIKKEGVVLKAARIKVLPEPWRANTDRSVGTIQLGQLLAYLNPTGFPEDASYNSEHRNTTVKDRFQSLTNPTLFSAHE